MEEKELIEKLNSVSRINAENIGHRAKLRIALLEAHENIRESQRISVFAWKIIPVGALALMFLVLGLSQEPPLSLKNMGTISEAKQILGYDKQTEPLINSGAIIGDTEIIGNRAYALMQLPEIITSGPSISNKVPTLSPALNMESDYRLENLPFVGGSVYLVEINLTDKRVIRIEKKLEKETIVGGSDQQVVNEIISQRGEQTDYPSGGMIIDRVEIVRPNLKLIRINDKFDLMPGSEQIKDTYLILKQGKEEWREKIETAPK